MARLSQSQLAGFRVGTNAPEAPPRHESHLKASPRNTPKAPKPTTPPVPSGASRPDPAAALSPLGPLPSAPTRTEVRHKIGLTLPLELAEQVRALTRQGYALADLVMVAYQNQRDRLLEEHQTVRPRRLVRHPQGRSPLTIALSHAERTALDTLAGRLGSTRSQTVTVLLDRHLRAGPLPQ